MSDAGNPSAAEWAGKAALRLVECESEARALPSDAAGRRRKLRARAARYAALAARLRAESTGLGEGDLTAEEAGRLAEEAVRLGARIREGAAELIRRRNRLVEIRARLAVRPSGGPEGAFPPLTTTDDGISRDAAELLRSLGL